MKKKFLILSLTLIIFCASLILIGCGTSNLNVKNNISDIRTGIFDGNNNEYFASLVYGEREQPYREDGISNNRVEFGIISVSFSEKQTKTSFHFKLVLENETIEGELEKNPYSKEFMADIGKKIDKESQIKLIVFINESESETTLTKKSINFKIDANTALKIGENCLKNEIIDMGKKNQCEFYLKIISDNNIAKEKYFWMFSVVSKDGEKHNAIFSTDSDEILVKN